MWSLLFLRDSNFPYNKTTHIYYDIHVIYMWYLMIIFVYSHNINEMFHGVFLIYMWYLMIIFVNSQNINEMFDGLFCNAHIV